MKRFFCILLILITSFSLIGCNTSSNTSKFKNDETVIYQSLKNQYPASKNLRVIVTEPFRDQMIVLFSYDIANGHFVDYRFFKEKSNEVQILGGGGGIAEVDVKKPLTFSSGGSISDDKEPYYFAYGEIFDEKIKQVRVEYSNGKIVTEKTVNNGYLTICEEKVIGVKKIEALDETSKIIYSIP